MFTDSSNFPHNPWVHRVAVLTCVVALLPLVMGALTTTIEAGMAFPDYPTSDGHNMFAYPWLNDLYRGALDKFCEHGHRLAGALIGIVSIGLVVVTWLGDRRRPVRWMAVAVLLTVIAQGLLGGARVLRVSDRLALVHGGFAAVVFCLMCVLAVATDRRWRAGRAEDRDEPPSPVLVALAATAPLVIAAQYVIGGHLRHLGAALYEHVFGAALVLIVAVAAAWFALRSPSGWVRRSGGLLLGTVLLQIGLGAAAFVFRFGWAPVGYVARMNAPEQVVIRTAHAVVGMLLLATAVVLLTKVLRVRRRAGRAADSVSRPSMNTEGRGFSPAAALVKGGAR
jgi:cytochrome c oxidase assembly protein subunit 15